MQALSSPKPQLTVDTKNPLKPLYTIVPLLPMYELLRVMQDFYYPNPAYTLKP